MEKYLLIDVEPYQNSSDLMYTVGNSKGVGRYNIYRYLEFVETHDVEDIRPKTCNRIIKFLKNNEN